MAGTLVTDNLQADVITEKTSGSGVTIEGVLLKDGVVTSTGPEISPVDPAITALGVDDTDAYALTKKISVITGGAVDTGVELMTAVVGLEVVIANLTSSDKKIYAGASDAIDDKTATTGFILIHPEQVIRLYCYTTALWQSDAEATAIYQNLYSDTIDEFTAAAGVTVDSVLLKDGGARLADGAALAADIITEKVSAAGVTIDSVLLKDNSISVADGSIGGLALKIGADGNNGLYGVSDTQLGIAVEGVLVGGADTAGLFTGNIAEQVVDAGVTIDGALIKDGSFIGKQATATATADGLTTGLLSGTDQFVSVTSASANNIICLPSDATCPIGTVIRGWVGANGFELRSLAADTTQTINNVTAGTTNEAAIPATTKFRVEKVASLTWILTAHDEVGAVITAIIPDAV